MPRYFHVTKLDKVALIRAKGLKLSSGKTEGGMSADSNEAYMYAEQDKDLLYLWTDIDYTDRFKTESNTYALIVVEVDNVFDGAHIDVAPKAKVIGRTRSSPELTTLVSNAAIPVQNLHYYKTREDYDTGKLTPLLAWGTFDMSMDKSDKRIWEGMT